MASLLEKTYHAVRNIQLRQRQARAFAKWERNGCPNPPPHLIKQRVLRDYASRFGLEVLVETGTYRGDMVHVMKDCFAKVYSIELSDQLFEAARRRFEGVTNVEIIHGDSSVQLEKLIPKLDRPTLFWLDGHYSAGITALGPKVCPVLEELDHIFTLAKANFVIVIDDARLFGTDPGYPTLDQVRQQISKYRSDADIHVDRDSIRITMPQTARAAA